jgi:23S rRNA (uracil1939-C5)-methyltransferase
VTLALEKAVCPHFGICGGCSIQHLAYNDQLRHKEKFVFDFLSGFSLGSTNSILPSPQSVFYRNKMEYSFGDTKDVMILETPKGQPRPFLDDPSINIEVHLGLHPRKRFNLVTPTPNCYLLSLESQTITRVVAAWATERKISTYVRMKNAGVLRHLIIREGKNTGERLVNLVSTSGLSQQHLDELAETLRESNVPITTFIWTIHDGLSDVAKGPKNINVWGEGFIHERVADIMVRIPHASFMQTNTHAAEKMIGVLKAWMVDSPAGSNVLFDLYCGTGVIGLNLADRFSRVIGIEIDSNAIEQAKENAATNKIQNATFVPGKVEDLMDVVRDELRGERAHLVVDPPRAGLHSRVIERLLQMEIPTIFYVSCNPESLARDLRALMSKYTIETVQPMDFFPHTDHVETAVKLSLKL